MEQKSENRICQNCKGGFVIELDDLGFYKKTGVPAPTWCPRCRFIRRMMFFNDRTLYKTTCDHCQKAILSIYHPNAPIPVWCVKCHISDTLDGCEFGREYDFTRPFFEQFQELKYNIPDRALDQSRKNDAYCEYSNLCFTSKDVYLSFIVTHSEHIKYSSYVLKNNKNCLDSHMIKDNDRGYELVKASSNYNSTFLVESDQCIDSHFLYDCSNCVSCCLSSNLRNKSFVFKNKQLTKEEYKKVMEALELGTYSGQLKVKEEFFKMSQKSIHRYGYIKNSVNAVGDYVENSKNAYQCYGVSDSENIKYAFFGSGTIKDSQDLVLPGRNEECYEVALGGKGASRVILSLKCSGGCKNLFYSNCCRTCSDCFGCVGLNNKQYCILNKQYTKEEYFNLVEKIKEHMNEMPYVDKVGRIYKFGEFFPPELSLFAYNETIAFEENPLSKEEILSLGYRWKDPEPKSYTATTKSENLPDSIKDVEDNICNEVIECPNLGQTKTQCTSAFRILPDELSFYRRMNLPIPRYCPNCRYHARLVWKNPFLFYKRQCMCDLSNHDHKGECEVEFETMYAPDRPEKIFCKHCYQKEVY